MTRKQEEQCECIIGKILDDNFYVTPTVRYTDKETQIKGIDVLWNNKKIDEKASVTYTNKELHTYALELIIKNRNNDYQDGWFINDTLETECYVFSTNIKAKNDLPKDSTDIIELSAYMLYKDAIKQYLDSIDWTEDRLRKKAYRILQNDDEYLGKINKNGITFRKLNHPYIDEDTGKKIWEESVVVLLPIEKIKELSFKNKEIKL